MHVRSDGADRESEEVEQVDETNALGAHSNRKQFSSMLDFDHFHRLYPYDAEQRQVRADEPFRLTENRQNQRGQTDVQGSYHQDYRGCQATSVHFN